MKSRKLIWIAALCVLSATVITVSLRERPTGVLAARHSVSRASLAQPAAYMSNASLRAAAMSNAMLLDDEGSARRVSLNMQRNSSLNLPPVEQFTLTPPNPALNITKTTVTVRFPELPAEKLASQIPMTLGAQGIVLQRSADDPSVFFTQVDFNWQTFAKEQEQRKEAASRGRMVSVFQGRHFVGTEKMQFVDPAEIQGALQSHQPMQFSPQILLSGTTDVFPDHELMIVNPAVVEDVGGTTPGRTFDQCLSPNPGNPDGAWTFATLMMAIANTTNVQTAETMLLNMLETWNSPQTINTFPVPTRPAMGRLASPGVAGSGLLGNWPVDPSNPTLPSLLNAPVRLNAIVNRIDLGQNSNPVTPGELRFVFGVTASATFSGTPQPCSTSAPPMNIILEYNVPTSIDPGQWANIWDSMKQLAFNDNPTGFMTNLQTRITNLVVTANACVDNNGHAISCLAALRTNELQLGAGGLTSPFWEQREFHLVQTSTTNQLVEATIAMTPDVSFDTAGKPVCGVSNLNTCNTLGTLANYINTNQSEIVQFFGALPLVPPTWPQTSARAFLGGSAFNSLGIGSANAFWNDTSTINDETARIFFSENTCNGCHGAETATTFQQVVNRLPQAQSNLASFLLGCTAGNNTCAVGGSQQCSITLENNNCQEIVKDPNTAFPNTTTPFGDIARRVTYLQSLVTNDPGGAGLLLPFVGQHIGVH